jgi:hypothetical protein
MLSLKQAGLLGVAAATICGIGVVRAEKPALAQSEHESRDRDDAYVLVRADGKKTMMNNWNDSGLRELSSHGSGDRIYVRRNGETYVITDHDTVDEALRLQKPLEEMGRKMEVLGKHMGEDMKVDINQAEIEKVSREAAEEAQRAVKDMKVDVHIPAIDIHIPAMDIHNMEDVEKATANIDVQMKDFDVKMKDFNIKMEEFGRKMAAVGEQAAHRSVDVAKISEKAAKIGERMGEFGRKMGEAGKEMDRRMHELINRAFDKGLAEPVH